MDNSGLMMKVYSKVRFILLPCNLQHYLVSGVMPQIKQKMKQICWQGNIWEIHFVSNKLNQLSSDSCLC